MLLNNPPEGSTYKFIEQEIRSTGLNDFQLGKRLCRIFIKKYTKCSADNKPKLLKKVVWNNMYKICETKNGQHLLIRIIRLLNEQSETKGSDIKIIFSWGDSITAEGKDKKILLKYEDLKAGTGFYLKNYEIELASRADVYIFHELLHLYHYLEDEEYYTSLEDPKKSLGDDSELKNSEIVLDAVRKFFTPEELKILNINTIYLDEMHDTKSEEIAKKNFELLKEHFPPVTLDQEINLEEMRTIIGSPYPIGGYKDLIICENSYRLEKGFPLRLNLLDSDDKNQKCSYFRQLETLIEYNSRYYLCP